MFFIALVALTTLSSACVLVPPTKNNQTPAGSNQPPVISSLEAKHSLLYPGGNSEIRCDVTDPDGDEVQLKWSCTNGRLIGAGSIVTWEAPNSYGEYPIMVIAEDGKGGRMEGWKDGSAAEGWPSSFRRLIFLTSDF